MIARGHWLPVKVSEMNVLNSSFYKRDVPTKISLDWNKVSGCHIKSTSASICWHDNAFSIAACRREIERLLNYEIKFVGDVMDRNYDVIAFVSKYLSAFLEIAKIDDFQWIKADVSRIQGMCHVIHIFFGSSLGKEKLPSFIVEQIVIVFKEGELFAPLPIYPWAALKRPMLNRVNIFKENWLWLWIRPLMVILHTWNWLFLGQK